MTRPGGRTPPPDPALEAGLEGLPGIGPARAAAYRRAGLVTRRQLLYHLPARYRRRSEPVPLETLEPGTSGALTGRVARTSVRRRGRRSTVSLVLQCEGGGELTALVFNRAYLSKSLRGARVWLAGKLDEETGRLLVSDYEVLRDDGPASPGELLPLYRLPAGIPPRVHRKVLAALFADLALTDWREPADGEPSLGSALATLHRPDDIEAARTARERLARDEAFALSLEVAARRRRAEGDHAAGLPIDDALHARLLDALPHRPTACQVRVLDELRADLAAPEGRPMARLLQGDVGSGKTMIALYAVLAAAACGRQGALMAPTEILAQQHAESVARALSRLLDTELPPLALVVGSAAAAERRAARAALAEGEALVAVGTHGLQSKPLAFVDLAVTVVDEQHRFGVRQRVRLRDKGDEPHLLVMTATPIPRTLALTAYGELDVSVLDELPPGRQPRITEYVLRKGQRALWKQLRAAVADGQQGYVVCPSIAGSSTDEDGEVHSVAATLQRVRAAMGEDVRVEGVHGRMKASRQHTVLDAFRRGEVQVLVATVLIEVGLDVPAATFVVVPDPSRFGLATLHQIRGRVGRGERPGRCTLLGPVKEGPARERVAALVDSEDGFLLAEKDLELRGPGEMLGTRQSGMPGFSVLDPVRDVKLLAETRAAALTAARSLSADALAALRRAAFPEMELSPENLLAGG